MEIKRIGSQPSTKGPVDIGIQEALDGKVVEWMEKVTDEQYDHAPRNTEKSL